MKLPNGYGSVSYNPGNRRKPYIVRKTIGWLNVKGKKIRKSVVIGYAETREAGLQMLAEYNNNPLNFNRLNMTFSEVYKAWSKQKYKALSKSSISSYEAAYLTCKPLYNKKFSTIKFYDLQNLVDNCEKNYPSLQKLKVFLKQLYNYAIKNEMCNKDYAAMLDLSPYRNQNPDSRPHERYTYEEVCEVWKYKDNPYIQTILMMLYSGVRVSELLDLKKENVFLEDHYFKVVKSKTDNGIRTVPIADCVYQFWVSWYNADNDCPYIVFNKSGAHFSYSNYYKKYYKPLLIPLGISKTPHCCRYTCASLLAEAKIDQVIVKKIIGHSSESVTERVYTHPDVPALLSAINSIPYPKG